MGRAHSEWICGPAMRVTPPRKIGRNTSAAPALGFRFWGRPIRRGGGGGEGGGVSGTAVAVLGVEGSGSWATGSAEPAVARSDPVSGEGVKEASGVVAPTSVSVTLKPSRTHPEYALDVVEMSRKNPNLSKKKRGGKGQCASLCTPSSCALGECRDAATAVRLDCREPHPVGSSPTCTSSFPKFPPRSISPKAAGTASIPCRMSSR